MNGSKPLWRKMLGKLNSILLRFGIVLVIAIDDETGKFQYAYFRRPWWT